MCLKLKEFGGVLGICLVIDNSLWTLLSCFGMYTAMYYLFRGLNFLVSWCWFTSGQGAACFYRKRWITMLFVVWIVNLNYWHEIGFDCNGLKIVLVITGPDICTHRPSLVFSLLISRININWLVFGYKLFSVRHELGLYIKKKIKWVECSTKRTLPSDISTGKDVSPISNTHNFIKFIRRWNFASTQNLPS